MSSAVLITAHHEPEHLDRLVSLLAAPEREVFIHVDAKSDIGRFARTLARRHVHPADRRVKVFWAGWSQFDSQLALIETATAFSRGFGRFVFISGVDYPLKPVAAIQAVLDTPAVEFVNCVRMPSPEAEKPLERLTRWYVEGGDHMPGRRAALIRALNRRLRRWPARELPRFLRDNPVGGGSAWWALTARAIEDVARFRREHPEVVAFYRRSVLVDEGFIQTVLLNSGSSHRIARNLTYTHWEPGAASPTTFSERHLPTLLDPELRLAGVYGEGPALFARKFSGAGAKVVDAIDAALGFENRSL